MTARSFVDTNVWVYAVDTRFPDKQRRAQSIIDPASSMPLATSAQVMGEFFAVATRKLSLPLGATEVAAMLDQLEGLPIVAIDAPLVRAAIAGSSEWKISYWDALIVRAAEVAGCDRVLTEDLTDGVVYGTVRVENPFAGQ
jgi:predicted nucleic acid-binding protein